LLCQRKFRGLETGTPTSLPRREADKPLTPSLQSLSFMDTFDFFILYRLPYIAFPFYFIMLVMRTWVWMRFYNPALMLLPGARGALYGVWAQQYRPTIHIFPGRPRTKAVNFVRAVKGFLFFSGLWKRDKILWFGSWSLHLGLLLVALAHVRVLVPLGATIDQMCVDVALVGSGLMTVAGIYLLFRRVIVQRVREITDFRDYLAELILLAFSATAFFMMHDGGVTSDWVRDYVAGVVSFSPTVVDPKPIFVWNMFCAQLLLIVTPFSHLLHSGGIFLSREFLGTSDTFAGEFGEPQSHTSTTEHR
jgi:nitrate reductase gamma subunit